MFVRSVDLFLASAAGPDSYDISHGAQVRKLAKTSLRSGVKKLR